MPQISYFNFSAKTLVILFACLFSSEASQSQKKDSPAGQNELAKGAAIPKPMNSNSTGTVESSQKPQYPQFPAIITSLSSNITLNLQSADEQEASASSTPKVVRHLGKLSGKAPRMGEKIVMQMLKMNSRRPSLLRSRIMGGGKPRELRLFKTVHQGARGPPGGEVTRYAPRSLDMGLGNLMNYNPVENLYAGNQPSLLPTSSSPNSLDHLYLPEMSVKDYMKPLDMNGLGNFGENPGGNEISNAIPYAEGFNYNERKGPGGPGGGGGFRGNPLDRNFHGSSGPPGMISGPSGPSGGGGPPEHFNEPPRGPPPPGGEFSGSSEKNPAHHHHHQQRRNPHGRIPDGPPHSHIPPHPPHEQPRGSPSNKFPRRDDGEDGGGRDHHHHHNPPHFPEGGPPELPPPPPISGNPGAEALQGDEGLWNILDLAQLLQNQGLTQQLSSVNSLAGVGGEPDGDGEGGPPNHFDAPSPGGGGPTNSPPGEGGDGPRGGKYPDGPNSSENEFGNYDGPVDHHEDGTHPPNRYNSPHKGKYGKPGRPNDHFGDEGDSPGGGDSSHYNDYNDGQRPGGSGGRGKPGRYNNNNNNNNNYQEGPEGHGGGGGGGEDSPDGPRMHGQPPPNPYKGDNDYNNPNGSERNHNSNNNRGAHGPGSPGPGPPNHFDEAVPNLDGNPGNDSPGPGPGPGGEGGGGEDGGEYPGEGGPPHEGYNTRDGPYDGYNSVNEYGGGYGQQGHPTNRPHSPSSTKPPHHGGDGGGPGGEGFDEDGEYNSQEQFDGPSGHPHHSSSGGSESGRGHNGHGEFPSDEGYYGGGYD